MKATRKLVPAFAMLLIAAVMMSTATFAWFSTNASVTATGMTVTAESSNTFLVISNDSSAIAGADYSAITAAATASADTKLYPTYFDPADNKWYTATGTSISDGAALGGVKTPLDSTANYVLEKTFYIRVADNFANASNLWLEAVTDNSAADYQGIVSVVAKVGEVYNSYDSVTGTYTRKAFLATEVNSTDVIAVTVYVYINGEHAKVTTENVNNLTDLGVTLTFSVGNEDSELTPST